MPFKYPRGNGTQFAKRQRVVRSTGRRGWTTARGNTTYGRGQYRRSGFYNRQYRAPRWAMKSAGIARALGVEKKFTTDSFVDGTVSDSWAFPALLVTDHAATEASSNLLMIAQGDGQSQRIGRKVMLTNISVRWRALRVAVDDVEIAPISSVFRMIWYIDRQVNGAAAATGDIMEDSGADFQQFRNLANSRRFKILKDVEVSLGASAGAGAGTAENDWAGELAEGQFHKILNMPIFYSSTATTGAIATIESNGIGMMCVSSVAEGVSVLFNIRARYTDC